MTEIRVDVDLEHPPSVVWRALTEAHLVTDWLPTTRFMIRDDGSFTFQATELTGLEDPIEGQIVTVESERRLVMRWEASNLHTVVAVTLAERGEGTRLTMTQSGFLGPQGTLRRRTLLGTYTSLFKGPLTATLAKIAAAPPPAPPAAEPTPRRNDGGPFNRLPRQLNAPSRSAPGLSSSRRSTAGPRPTTTMPGFAAAVLGARATGVAKVTEPTVAFAPAHGRSWFSERGRSWYRFSERGRSWHRFSDRGRSWLRAVWRRLAGARDWSADRRSQAVATGAAVLLLLALAAILIGKATALHPAKPPRTGGESPGPVQVTVPGAAIAPTRATSNPIVSAASRPPSALPASPTTLPATAPVGAAQLTAAYRTEDLSLTAYRVTVTIANPTAITASNWQLVVQLPLLDLSVTNVNGAVLARTDGHLNFTPVDATRTIKPGATAAVRFDVEGLGVRNEPFTCAIDTRSCTVATG
ncbi:SRPBCC domain-containing protein [Dactylosporangium sp. CS-033363]|uniref:SRPBCC domain-containing protein n=1 Tax=Dactylosporangium sp. CS-033363 TaxID=3239935 RepID=UPI003D8F6E2C